MFVRDSKAGLTAGAVGIPQDVLVRSSLSRLLPTAIMSIAALAAMTACSGTTAETTSASATPSPTASATAVPLACVSSGSASSSVKVTGALGAAPKVSFASPLTPTATQKSVIVAGKGEQAKQGSQVQIAYTMYDAKTGVKAVDEGYGAGKAFAVTVDSTQLLTGLANALDCAQAGSRIAAVLPASQAFGATGLTSKHIGKNDPVVLVVDVVSITPTKATGTAKALPAGFPKVTLAASGKPTVAIPATTQPTTLKIAESKHGSGEVVKSGDTVTVQYQGVIWRTGAVFDQSWGKTTASFVTSQVVKGFGDALVGHHVGSQVVAIIPPKYGYGTAGSTAAGIKGTDDMVFVIDILSTTHAE
jgi:peptidylprolyl isomerase